ncbi:unnamed protein product [Gongylonema pulchrum]|uniref:CAP-Gly domain-containing protein n=1 Tax=Gongylonema pulchrum TaxID=637853 RepID=A0A183CVU8_9BILA|nr:unnamed protein product [Gongylonema pulchrum]
MTALKNENERSRDGSHDRTVRGTFAFGSSTPRLLSHLYNDAKINPQVGRRSYTTPAIPTTRSKTVPAPVKIHVTRTTKITHKSPGAEQKRVISSTTHHVVSINHKRPQQQQQQQQQQQPKEGSKEFMNSVKEKLENQKNTMQALADKTAKKVTEIKVKPSVGKAPKSTKDAVKTKKIEKSEGLRDFSRNEELKSPAPSPTDTPNLEIESSEPQHRKDEETIAGTIDVLKDEVKVPAVTGTTPVPEEETKVLAAAAGGGDDGTTAVRQDEAKALTIEATHPQHILSHPLPEEDEGSSLAAKARIKSMEDNRTVQQVIGDDEMTELESGGAEAYHLGSIGHGDVSNATVALISKVAEHLNHMDEKALLGPKAQDQETLATSPLQEEQEIGTPASERGDIEASGIEQIRVSPLTSSTPFPEAVTMQLPSHLDHENSRAKSTTDEERQPRSTAFDEKEGEMPIEELKHLARSEELRHSAVNELSPEKPDQPQNAVPESHELSGEEHRDLNPSFVYNYGYEYHSATTEERLPEESLKLDSSKGGDPGMKDQKKSGDTVEGISAL